MITILMMIKTTIIIILATTTTTKTIVADDEVVGDNPCVGVVAVEVAIVAVKVTIVAVEVAIVTIDIALLLLSVVGVTELVTLDSIDVHKNIFLITALTKHDSGNMDITNTGIVPYSDVYCVICAWL